MDPPSLPLASGAALAFFVGFSLALAYVRTHFFAARFDVFRVAATMLFGLSQGVNGVVIFALAATTVVRPSIEAYLVAAVVSGCAAPILVRGTRAERLDDRFSLPREIRRRRRDADVLDAMSLISNLLGGFFLALIEDQVADLRHRALAKLIDQRSRVPIEDLARRIEIYLDSEPSLTKSEKRQMRLRLGSLLDDTEKTDAHYAAMGEMLIRVRGARAIQHVVSDL